MKLLLTVIAIVVAIFIVLQRGGKRGSPSLTTPGIATYLQGLLDSPFDTKRIQASCFDPQASLFRIAPGQTCTAVFSSATADHRKLRLSLLEPPLANAEFHAQEEPITNLVDQRLKLDRTQESSIIVGKAGGTLALTCPALGSPCTISAR